ncbi:hypothetical protein F4703DRAFT_1894792 [Phycomyces blakesleeanus]
MTFNNFKFVSVDPTQPAPRGRQLHQAIANENVETIEIPVISCDEVPIPDKVQEVENFEDDEEPENNAGVESSSERANDRIWCKNATKLFLKVVLDTDIYIKTRSAGGHKRKIGHLWDNFLVTFKSEPEFKSLPRSFRRVVDSSKCNSKFRSLKKTYKKATDKVLAHTSRGITRSRPPWFDEMCQIFSNCDSVQTAVEEPSATRSGSTSFRVPLTTSRNQIQPLNVDHNDPIFDLIASVCTSVTKEVRVSVREFAEAFLDTIEEKAEKKRRVDAKMELKLRKVVALEKRVELMEREAEDRALERERKEKKDAALLSHYKTMNEILSILAKRSVQSSNSQNNKKENGSTGRSVLSFSSPSKTARISGSLSVLTVIVSQLSIYGLCKAQQVVTFNNILSVFIVKRYLHMSLNCDTR